MIRKAETKLTPAGAYIRMSGDRQEKSPAQQRVEITKLAKHEGFAIVEWQTDEAITGNTTTEDRPGLAALLAAAKAGKFKTVLALHTNRISREDPMDAVVFYNQLRKAGVGLHTCRGRRDRPGQLYRTTLAIREPEGQQRLLDQLVATNAYRQNRQRQGGWQERRPDHLRDGPGGLH